MTAQPLSRLDRTSPSADELRASTPATRSGYRRAWWRRLTALESKWRSYHLEAHFREALHDGETVLEARLAAVLQAHCQLTIKPDGIAARRIEPVISFMVDHGFVPVAQRIHYMSGAEAREIWRYQWNVATLDRLRLFDMCIGQSECLTVYFRDTTNDPHVPATVRLRGHKGSAVPELRTEESLRSACAAPNRLMTFVHAADEPIDLLREFGILYDSPARADLLQELELSEPLPASWLALTCDRLYGENPRCDFDRGDAEAAIGDALARVDPLAADAFRRITDDGKSFYDWTVSYAHLISRPNVWDVVTAASFRILHDLPGVVCSIDDDGRPEWYAGEGDRFLPGEDR